MIDAGSQRMRRDASEPAEERVAALIGAADAGRALGAPVQVGPLD